MSLGNGLNFKCVDGVAFACTRKCGHSASAVICCRLIALKDIDHSALYVHLTPIESAPIDANVYFQSDFICKRHRTKCSIAINSPWGEAGSRQLHSNPFDIGRVGELRFCWRWAAADAICIRLKDAYQLMFTVTSVWKNNSKTEIRWVIYILCGSNRQRCSIHFPSHWICFHYTDFLWQQLTK